jgi:drug/metabolite transporter (DMT)-like permease
VENCQHAERTNKNLLQWKIGGGLMKSKMAQGHVAALVTIIIWGTTFISTKVLLEDFFPIEILFFRFLLGLTMLYIVYPYRLIVKNKKEELTFLFAGLSGVCLYYLLENIALTYTLASNVGIIISIAPFFTAIFTHLFMKEDEKLNSNFFVGFIFAILGIFLINFSGKADLEINPLGDILAIMAAVVWAIYSVLSKKISQYGYNTVQSTRRVFTYGILFMIPALFVFDFRFQPERFMNMQNLLNILFLGIGASAICFVTWNIAVKILGAVKTSVYIYLVPVITIITSVIILKEKVTIWVTIGTAMTLLGLLLSEYRGKKR